MDEEIEKLYRKKFQPLYSKYLKRGRGFNKLVKLVYKTHPELLDRLSPDEARSLEYILTQKIITRIGLINPQISQIQSQEPAS